MAASSLTVISVFLTMLVLAVGAWNLYLSHYKKKRSEVEVLPQENNPTSGFGGGNHAIDDSARWTGYFYIKVANTGDRGAYVATLDHELKGFRKSGKLIDAGGTELEAKNHRANWTGKELEPNSTTRYRGSATIEPEGDIRLFVENDYAVIEHVLTVEDNQGSYTVTHETDMELTGPEGALENWRDANQESGDV